MLTGVPPKQKTKKNTKLKSYDKKICIFIPNNFHTSLKMNKCSRVYLQNKKQNKKYYDSFVNFSCKLYNHKQIANVDLVLLFVYAQVTTTHNLKKFLAFCLILNFELSSAIVSILIRSDFDLAVQEVYE